MENCCNIREILAKESLTVHFQPIISLKEREIVGLEALSRGIHPASGDSISPLELFAKAEAEGFSLELDRLCRKKALEAFAVLGNLKKTLLFVNLNASILDAATTGSGHFFDMTRAASVAPERVAIEVVESKVNDPKYLKAFSERYREAGFLIVVDDFGTEHSNLERLIQVKPDILKIDRQIVSGVDGDHYKQSVLKSICGLSEMIGALSLAEGVETQGELHTCHQLGVDLFQGFLFAKPAGDFAVLERETRKRIDRSVASIDEFLAKTLGEKSEATRNFETLTRLIVRSLRNLEAEEMAARFSRFAERHDCIECIYLLDERGRQLTETVCSPGMLSGVTRHSLFQPAPKHADHSLKAYYYYIKNLGIRRYFTDPYLSLATGHLCRTMAVVVDTTSRKNCVLCIDFLESSGDDEGLPSV